MIGQDHLRREPRCCLSVSVALPGPRLVLIHLAMRRFLCVNAACVKVTFAGQADGLTARYQRWSVPLAGLMSQICAGAGRARWNPAGWYRGAPWHHAGKRRVPGSPLKGNRARLHPHVVVEAPVMAGPGGEMAARAGDGGRLRASHADREQVIGTLKAAFVRGSLDKGEFDLLVGRALASRTYADLAAVTADIPAGLAAAQPPEPAWAQGQPVLRPGQVIMAASVLYAAVWAALFLSSLGNDDQVADPVIGMTTLTYLGVLAVALAAMLELRRERRSGGRLPPRPAQRGQALGDGRDSGIGDDLTLFEVRGDARARHLPGHGVCQGT